MGKASSGSELGSDMGNDMGNIPDDCCNGVRTCDNEIIFHLSTDFRLSSMVHGIHYYAQCTYTRSCVAWMVTNKEKCIHYSAIPSGGAPTKPGGIVLASSKTNKKPSIGTISFCRACAKASNIHQIASAFRNATT